MPCTLTPLLSLVAIILFKMVNASATFLAFSTSSTIGGYNALISNLF